MADLRMRMILEAVTAGANSALAATGKQAQKTKGDIKDMGQEGSKSVSGLSSAMEKLKSVTNAVEGVSDLVDSLGHLKEGLKSLGVDPLAKVGEAAHTAHTGLQLATLGLAAFGNQLAIAKVGFAVATAGMAYLGSAIGGVIAKASAMARAFDETINQFKGNPFIAAAIEAQRLETSLRSMTGSAAVAAKRIQELGDVADKTPFELPGLVEADIQLRSFTVSAERFIPIAATLAAVTGRTVPEAATAMGKAFSGISEGITALQESFRVTRRDLIQFGAQLDENGAIANKTVDQMNALATATERAVNSKFGNVLEEQSKTLGGVLSSLEDSFGRLKAGVGLALAPVAMEMVKLVQAGVDMGRTLVPVFQAIVEAGMDFVSTFKEAILVVGGGIAVIGTLLPVLGACALAFSVLGAPIVGAAAAVVLLTGSITLALGALINWNHEVHMAAEEAKKFQEQAQGINTAFAKNQDVIGKSVEELVKMGHTSKDVAAAISGLQEKINRFSNIPGAEKVVASLKDQLKALLGIKSGLADYETQHGLTIAAVTEGAGVATKAWTTFQLNRKKQIFNTKEEELSALDAVIAAHEKSAADIERIDKSLENSGKGDNDPQRQDLAKRAAEIRAALVQQGNDRVDIARDALQREFDLVKTNYEQQVALGKKSKEEQAAFLLQLANDPKYKALHDAQLATQREADLKSIESQKEIKQAVIERHEAEKSALESKAALVEEDLSRGKNVLADEVKLKGLTQARYEKEIALVREKLAVQNSTEGQQKVRDANTAKAEAEILGLTNQEAEAIRKVGETARSVRAEQIKELVALKNSETAVVEAQLAGIEKKIERGAALEGQAKSMRANIQQANEEAIRQTAEADAKTAKTALQRAHIMETADNAIKASREKFRQDSEDKEIASVQRVADRRLAAIKTEQDALNIRKSIVEEEIELGLDYGQGQERLKEIIRQSLDLKKQELAATRDQAIAGKEGPEKSKIENDYRNQITSAIRESKTAMEELNDKYRTGNKELDKAAKLLDKIRGKREAKENEEEEGSSSSPGGISDNPNGSGGPSLFDLQKQERIQAEKVKKLEKEAARKRARDAQAELDKKPGKTQADQARAKLIASGLTPEQADAQIKANFGDGTKPPVQDTPQPFSGTATDASGGGTGMAAVTARLDRISRQLDEQTAIGRGYSGTGGSRTKGKYSDIDTPLSDSGKI